MPRAPTAKRYAQAAFEIARESGQIEGWSEDLRLAQEALQDEILRNYLETSRIPIAQKVQFFQDLLGNLHPNVLNLVALLTSRSVLTLLPMVYTEYQRLVDDYHNLERAEVVTVVPLEEEQQKWLIQQLSQLLGKDVAITTSIDPEVLGGFMVRVGDRIIDGSLRGRLMALRKSLVDVAA